MSRHALNTWTMALIFVSIASAQPDTLWTKTYGTAGEELLYSIDQTADGGFVMSGITGWGTGSDDYWLVRTDASGDTIWTRTYGGPGADETQSGQLTTDGGYIMAGLGEMWLIRTNENGDTLWTLRSGGPGGSESPHVALTNDGGYIITGNFPDEVNHAQVGIVKVDDLGNILWTKTYGDPDDEFGSFVQPTADNGYVILGYKDITYPNHEFWLLKTDAAGDTTWTTVIPTANGEANVVRQTADGGYAIFGLIFGTLAAPDNDAPRDWLLIKTDASGNVDWSQTYGSLGDDQSMDMIITDDDGFLLTGWSHQTDLEDADLWLVQTDTSGAEVWDTFVGSTGMDIGIGLVQIADGEYAITGGTGSWGAGGFDGWLVRFGAGPDPFEQDSLALVDLYNSTDGANWMNPWTLTDPVSTWGGVTVTDGRVTSLYLYDNKLDGTIPASIGTLTALTILQIAGNYTLSGPIPIEIGNLTSLTSLEFNNNQLNGEIPSEIGYLTALTSLNLYGNYQITGSIPASIGNLTNLTSISLARNELTGAIPSTIGDMTSLQSLSLNENQLSDAIPSEIGNLTSLTYLALYSNQLTGSIPTTIATLDNLTGLNFYDNLLTGSIPTFIGSMTNLTSIRLNNNGFSGAIPDEISSLTNLTYLDLSENQLTGAVPPEFSALAVLVTLDLSQNQLTGLPDLSGLPLAHLILHNNRFTFEDLEPNVDVSDIIYSPQYWVGTVIDTTVEKGTSLTLTASVGGTANHYQWREGVWDIEDSTATTFTFESLDFDDDGVYTYRVTNDIVTGLTLYSHPITITVADTTPPAVPQNLTAEAAGDEARLTWDQNSEPDF
ncbi:MAG: hypothetical protein KAU50_10390, partial [Candidatus Marinimicrobia bacterium]|nr:hypothetical protein [Candidatus Neomarinimicrobiota bacterium]